MKRLLMTALVAGQICSVNAEIVIKAGETTFGFSEADKDSAMVKSFRRVAEIENKGLELREKREQIKDQLGLGELERMTVSGSEPSYETLKMYRGANTDQLFSLLQNEHFTGYWRVIARSIGIVADEESAKRLASFAASAFPLDNEATRQYHIAAREGAIWGLLLADRDQPMPWVKEFVIAHADPDQWVKDFGNKELDHETAQRLAKNTLSKISYMGSAESLAILKEIRSHHSSQASVQPFSEDASDAKKGEELDYIDALVEQTQLIAKKRAEQAEMNLR